MQLNRKTYRRKSKFETKLSKQVNLNSRRKSIHSFNWSRRIVGVQASTALAHDHTTTISPWSTSDRNRSSGKHDLRTNSAINARRCHNDFLPMLATAEERKQVV